MAIPSLRDFLIERARLMQLDLNHVKAVIYDTQSVQHESAYWSIIQDALPELYEEYTRRYLVDPETPVSRR